MATKKEPRKIDYLVCAFCGKTTPIEVLNIEKLKDIDPITWKLIQIRARGEGQRGGFPVIRGESLTMRQVVRKKEYKTLVEALRFRLTELISGALDSKLLREEDLRGLIE